MSPVTAGRAPSARERLLAAADELFYAEGINSVGIDRVIEHAGVAKATLYSAFGSKDELIRAYLLRRHDLRLARIERHVAAAPTPRDRMLAVYTALDELITSPQWRGCPFLAATGEARTDAVVNEVAALTRDWTHARFEGLAAEAGAADPAALATRLVLLYDGAVVAAQIQRDITAAATARAMATAVIEAAV